MVQDRLAFFFRSFKIVIIKQIPDTFVLSLGVRPDELVPLGSGSHKRTALDSDDANIGARAECSRGAEKGAWDIGDAEDHRNLGPAVARRHGRGIFFDTQKPGVIVRLILNVARQDLHAEIVGGLSAGHSRDVLASRRLDLFSGTGGVVNGLSGEAARAKKSAALIERLEVGMDELYLVEIGIGVADEIVAYAQFQLGGSAESVPGGVLEEKIVVGKNAAGGRVLNGDHHAVGFAGVDALE